MNEFAKYAKETRPGCHRAIKVKPNQTEFVENTPCQGSIVGYNNQPAMRKHDLERNQSSYILMNFIVGRHSLVLAST
jgi:hypothetical protein